MILFDYIYYFFCNLYKLSKEERQFSGFKDSAGIVGGGSIALLLLPSLYLVDERFEIKLFNPTIFVIICICTILFFWIRYKKITSYEKIKIRLSKLSNTSISFLNIFLAIYLLSIIAGLSYLIYIGITNPLSQR